jgi:hypothetical protein
MDFHLFGGWHVTLFTGAWLFVVAILVTLAGIVLIAKALMAH